MSSINFIVSDTQKSVALAAGITGKGEVFSHCSLHVGDVVSFPGSPHLFWKVVSRMYSAKNPPADGEWFVFLEPTQEPFAAFEARQQ